MSYKNILENTKEIYKIDLIDQTLDIFLEKSIDVISMNQLAKELEVGVASLYRYFKSKNNLVIQCGIRLWERIGVIFEGIFETEQYKALSGYQQLEQLMKIQLVLYEGHPAYLSFISEFDSIMIKNKVTSQELVEYENSIFTVGEKVYHAYQKGIEDKTIKAIDNFDEFYTVCTITLQALTQKLLGSRAILESDSKYDKSHEIQIIIDLILDKVRGQ